MVVVEAPSHFCSQLKPRTLRNSSLRGGVQIGIDAEGVTALRWAEGL